MQRKTRNLRVEMPVLFCCTEEVVSAQFSQAVHLLLRIYTFTATNLFRIGYSGQHWSVRVHSSYLRESVGESVVLGTSDIGLQVYTAYETLLYIWDTVSVEKRFKMCINC